MVSKLKVKQNIHSYLVALINSKITESENAIAAAKDARNNDTKSSAGDKFETGRAMMQQEIDKSELQLHVALKQLQELSKIDLSKRYAEVEQGSLVVTDNAIYFISIGLGKITLGQENYFVISLASPIGKAFNNKLVGDEIDFQNQRLRINEIY